MSMDAEPLVRMANQIGTFFEAMPDRDEAIDGIAQHIRRFWDPRMRTALLAAIDADHAQALRPMVSDAIARHRADLQP